MLILDGGAQSNRPILIKVSGFLKNEEEYFGNQRNGYIRQVFVYN